MFKKEFQKFKENYVILDNNENKHLETDYTKNNNLLIIFIKNKSTNSNIRGFYSKWKTENKKTRNYIW